MWAVVRGWKLNNLTTTAYTAASDFERWRLVLDRYYCLLPLRSEFHAQSPVSPSSGDLMIGIPPDKKGMIYPTINPDWEGLEMMTTPVAWNGNFFDWERDHHDHWPSAPKLVKLWRCWLMLCWKHQSLFVLEWWMIVMDGGNMGNEPPEIAEPGSW